MVLKTQTLQEMVAKSIKCVTNNKLIPITSLISIKVEDGVLTLTTTDATNYFYVSYPENVENENIEFSVLADLFVKLIQKITTDTVELSINEGMRILNIKGNGNYTLELPLDENGSLIKFPKKFDISASPFDNTLKKSNVEKVVNYNKNSLAISLEIPVLTDYYCGESVVTSDKFKICDTKVKLFENPTLVTPQLMELLCAVSGDDINYVVAENYMVFGTTYETIYAPITEGVGTFPIEAISKLVAGEFESKCKIPKASILDVLDRIALFVTSYDKKAIYLTFTQNGLMISSKKSSGVEVIPYVISENFADFTCCIDFEMLRSQISTQTSENIELHYGSDIAVKLVDGEVTQIVALAQDDRN